MTKWLDTLARLGAARPVALLVARSLLLLAVALLAGHGALEGAAARKLCESFLSSQLLARSFTPPLVFYPDKSATWSPSGTR